ncbi:DUF1540 domain-containing protein [Effusibacillus dendaii]|uniref:DUF1540 domain-containing protein n=1 Tax=Effusibacillus dendaii TaxID=2743772 RepID=A0A7I8D7L7_9BACL|nr:DUF1540 domain-containing protein [Effusibacillus dendaii]BCJ85382.1 hypothetical protein skT53_03670 [Effusibacillus dendaii]
MPNGVKCGVEECIFNDKDRNCTADAIEVLSNGNEIVGTTKGTRCATFEFERHDNRYGATVR